MLDQEERLLAHEIRKSERAGAFGLQKGRNRSRTTIVESKVVLTKEEEELLRSMALTVEDNPWQRIQFTNKFNSLAPTYDPTALSVLSYQNNTLRVCIAAMVACIDGTGYEIVRKDGAKIQQIPAPPQPAPAKGALQKDDQDDDQGQGVTNQLTTGSAKPQPGNKASDLGSPNLPDLNAGDQNGSNAEPQQMIDPPDVARIKAFYDEPYPGVSFHTMRVRMRDQMETTGNGYLEVIRDQSGKLALLNPMDSKLSRLIRHDDLPVAVEMEVNRSGIPGEGQKVTLLVHERRFVQIIGLNARFFKVYKATRNLNAQTGVWQNDSQQPLQVQDNATEVLHFTVEPDVLTPYGIPRWINQIPSVMGSRSAEELNLEFFRSGGVPPAIVLIQGGTLTPQARNGLTDYLAGSAKFKQRGVVVEIAPSGGDLNSAAQVKASVEKLGDATGSDSKFEKYDDKCTQRVRMAFRLPPLLIGLAQDYNYATAQTALMYAEEQVFKPERKKFDEIINSTIMKEIDPSGQYLYKSKDMTAKFLDEQLKAMQLAAGKVDGQSFVKALNDIAGLDLKFDQVQDALNKATQQANLQNAQNGGPGQESTGFGGGSEASDQGGPSAPSGGGQGFAQEQGQTSNGLSKSEGSPSHATAINKDDPAVIKPDKLRVQVTKQGRIRKLDNTILTDLAQDWSDYLLGNKEFLSSHVESMHKLVKSMTPGLRNLFGETVSMKVIGASHDPNGVRQLITCASDVLARMEKGGDSLTATPKGLSKSNPNHDPHTGEFAAAGDSNGQAVATLRDKNGQEYEIRHRIASGDKQAYDVAEKGAPRGSNIASAELRRDRTAVSSMETRSDYRGHGIMTALYQHIEAHQGHQLTPNRALTGDGEQFWKRFRPDAKSLPLEKDEDNPDAVQLIAKAGQPLYVHRPVINGKEIVSWAKNQGFTTCLPPEALHVTVCYSKQPFDHGDLLPEQDVVRNSTKSGVRSLAEFGPEKDTVVLKFQSPALQKRWQQFLDAGASWDWEGYSPHVSLTMQKPDDLDVSKVQPYDGIIELGPEEFGLPEKGANSDLIEKFDPYHDAEGKFTSANGTGSGDGRQYRRLDQTGQLGYKVEDAKDFAQKVTDPATLTESETKAVRTYQGAGAADINFALREDDHKRLSERQAATIPLLDKLIGEHTLPEDVTLFRGMDLEPKYLQDGAKQFADLKGKTFTDNGFVSTSVRESIATTFSEKSGVIVEIHAPQGMHAIAMTEHFDESEVLLPRGSTFRVLEASESKYDDKEGHWNPGRLVVEPVLLKWEQLGKAVDHASGQSKRFVWGLGDIQWHGGAVKKSNPNHDPHTGEFTSAGAGEGAQVRPLTDAEKSYIKGMAATVSTSRPVSMIKSTKPKKPIPATKDLVELRHAVSSYTGSFSTKLSAMSAAYTKTGQFPPDASELVPGQPRTYAQAAETLMSAIKNADPVDTPLYRGFDAPTTRDMPLEQLLHAKIPELEDAKVGDTLDMPGVKSFSHSQGVGEHFADEGASTNTYLIQTTGPVKAFNVAEASYYPEQQEAISMGKFKVVGVEKQKLNVSGRGIQRWRTVLTVKQESV